MEGRGGNNTNAREGRAARMGVGDERGRDGQGRDKQRRDEQRGTQEMSRTSLGSRAACPSFACPSLACPSLARPQLPFMLLVPPLHSCCFPLVPPCSVPPSSPVTRCFVVALLFRLAWLLAAVVLGAGVVAVSIVVVVLRQWCHYKHT